jgi:hypothetical protein
VRSELLIALALLACGKQDEATPKGTVAVAEKPRLGTMQMRVPGGWSATYDEALDVWRFPSGIVFERAPEVIGPSPEALRQYLKMKEWPKGAQADITHRAGLRDGYVVRFDVKTTPPHAETYVIRQLGSEWFRCYSTALDVAQRDDMVALCKSIKW